VQARFCSGVARSASAEPDVNITSRRLKAEPRWARLAEADILENLAFMTASPESCADATSDAGVISGSKAKIFAKM
jgi:hypothetical protein